MQYLRNVKRVEWQPLYWKLISCTTDFDCKTCGEHFSGDKINQCLSHANKAFTGLLDTSEVYYSCCNTKVFRFNAE